MTNNIVKSASEAAEAIRQSDGIIIGAGAGMGVDSGLPDFRGANGLWKAYPALGDRNINFSEIANPLLFTSEPELAWGFYGHRLELYRQFEPHKGFSFLRKIGEHMTNGYQVFTSNVDGHFQKAGFKVQRVFECHGSINYLQCSKACSDEIWSASDVKLLLDNNSCLATSELPICHKCGLIARPNILMFDDMFFVDPKGSQQRARMQANINAMQKPIVIECGAGVDIPTVRYFCQSQKAKVIRINPRDSDIHKEHGIGLACGALEGLTLIHKILSDTGFFE